MNCGLIGQKRVGVGAREEKYYRGDGYRECEDQPSPRVISEHGNANIDRTWQYRSPKNAARRARHECIPEQLRSISMQRQLAFAGCNPERMNNIESKPGRYCCEAGQKQRNSTPFTNAEN